MKIIRTAGERYRPILASPVRRWCAIAGAWTVYALFMATQAWSVAAKSGTPIAFGGALASEAIYAGLWVALTPVILRFSWRFPIESGNVPARVALHLGASIVVALAQKAVFHFLFAALTAAEGRPVAWGSVWEWTFLYLDYGFMNYWGLALLRHGYDYFRRYHANELEKSKLESQLVRARLQALEMQLQPHFLFNTLNAVAVLIQRDPAAARTMITKLSELLRLTLEKKSSPEVSLREELEILDCYLHIEQTRFGDRLTVTREIGAGLMDALVPALLLQPIVENAMHHGVARRRAGTSVAVRAERANGDLRLEVSDTGPGIDPGAPLTEGIGLSTTRERLRQLYGDRSTFELRPTPGGGLTVVVRLPHHTAPIPA